MKCAYCGRETKGTTEIAFEQRRQLMSQLEELLARKEKLEKRYNEKLKERERNSIECNRIESNECYFILKTKLFNITEANDMLHLYVKRIMFRCFLLHIVWKL